MSDTQDDLDRKIEAVKQFCGCDKRSSVLVDAVVRTCRAHFQQGEPVAEACPYCGGTEGHWEGCEAPVMLPSPAKKAQEEPVANGLKGATSSIDYWQRRGYLGSPEEWAEACRLFRVRCSDDDCSQMAKLRTYIEEGLLLAVATNQPDMVMVPREPTEERLKRGVRAFQSGFNGTDNLSDWLAFWQAMITDAPANKEG